MKSARIFAPLLVVIAGCASEPPPAPNVPTPKLQPIAETPRPTSPPVPPPEPTKAASAPSLASVVSDAKAAGKVPLLLFSTVWCQPCEMLEKDVLPKDEVVKALAPFQVQKYDAEIGEGFAAAQKLGIASYPTMVFLDANGEEVSRSTAPTQPSKFIDEVTSKLALAKAGKAPPAAQDGDPLVSNDLHRVMTAAQSEEARPDLVRAKKLYVVAAQLAAKQKQPEVAAEAAYAILQLDTREQDRKAHAAKLLVFVKAQAPAPKALDALEGLAGLAKDAGIKAADVKASATKLETALVAAHKDLELRRLGAVMKKLGDEEAATRLEAVAAKEGANKPSTPEMIRFADPLGTKFTFSGGGGRPLSAQAAFPGLTTRRLVEDCHHLPHPNEPVDVRVYASNGAITKAVILDPELPIELRTCLEKSALSIKNAPADAKEKMELHVSFAPAKH